MPKRKKDKAVAIPELDAAAATYQPKRKRWTDREKQIVRKYYRLVPNELLLKHLPGRNLTFVHLCAQNLRAEGIQLEIDKQ